jgi:hypothetical protein
LTPRKTAQNERNDYVRWVLQGIVQKQDGDVQLINVQRLRSKLKVKPLSLDHFYSRLNMMTRVWMKATFLVMKNDEEENLDEDGAIADSAGRINRGRSRSPTSRLVSPPVKRRKLERKIVAHSPVNAVDASIDDSSSNHDSYTDGSSSKDDSTYEDDSSDTRPAEFSESPRQNSSNSSIAYHRTSTTHWTQKKKYVGRRNWTAVETTAVKEGVRRVGAHVKTKWATIKKMYPDELKDRTSTQVKVSTTLYDANTIYKKSSILRSHWLVIPKDKTTTLLRRGDLVDITASGGYGWLLILR